MLNLNFLKIKKNYKKENFKINPDFFWKILVIFFGLLIIIFFFFSYNLFSKINTDSLENIKEKSSGSNNKEQIRLEKVLEYFSERQKKSEEIINSSSSVVDPAL